MWYTLGVEKERKRTQIMTVGEVAKYLGVHPVTVYHLIKDTDIPAFKLKGQWRFKKDILDQWLEAEIHKREGDGREVIV
ncbi:MAG: helix-turn-helix domain-containing protein [Candidatus Omnitrophota bacterium]